MSIFSAIKGLFGGGKNKGQREAPEQLRLRGQEAAANMDAGRQRGDARMAALADLGAFDAPQMQQATQDVFGGTAPINGATPEQYRPRDLSIDWNAEIRQRAAPMGAATRSAMGGRR